MNQDPAGAHLLLPFRKAPATRSNAEIGATADWICPIDFGLRASADALTTPILGLGAIDEPNR